MDCHRNLEAVRGKVLRVYLDDPQHRMTHGLLYYFNKADVLRKSAEILMSHGETREVFTMLAGMSLELLLKGVLVGLDVTPKATHRLRDLIDAVGLAVDDDERVLLDVMTEHVFWAGRYTAPRKSQDWSRFDEIRANQRHGGSKWLDNPSRTIGAGVYRRLWAKVAECFWQVKEARPESAATTIEDRLLNQTP